jgi:hypothetical protein
MIKKLFLASASILMLAIAYHLGATEAHGGVPGLTPTEVVVTSGTCANGDELPLPMYRDGTTASETECTFLVIPRQVSSSTSSYNRFYADGRIARVEWDGERWGPQLGATYVVIATRGSGVLPTPTLSRSWGALKAKALK